MWGSLPVDTIPTFNSKKLRKKAPKETCDPMLNSPITAKEVEECIKELKNGAPGDDMIPNSVWKCLNMNATHKLAKMFETHRLMAKFPNSWKFSDIKWIFKKDDPLDIKNYRPIALGNTLGKIFTKILTNRLSNLVEATNIVSEEQQGFCTDRGCIPANIAQNIYGKKI